MMRLIDADKLKQAVLDWENCYNGFSDTYDKARIIDEIDAQPTIEAEPIVRCKDCIYSSGTLKYCSIDHWVNRDGTSFCSYGEKKDE